MNATDAALRRLENALLARGRAPLTAARYLSTLRRFLAAVNVEDPAQLRQEHTESFLADLRRQGAAPRTLRFYHAVVKAFARVTGGDFALEEAPAVVAEVGHRPAFTAAEVAALIRAARQRCGPDDRALLAVSTTWGLRRTELASLRAGDLRLEERQLLVRTAKRGAPKLHLIPEQVVPVLAGWAPAPRHVSVLTERFHRICFVCGVAAPPGGGWHSIRRRLTSELDRAGVLREGLRAFMRWRGVTDTAAIYIIRDTTADDAAVLAKHPFLKFWEE